MSPEAERLERDRIAAALDILINVAEAYANREKMMPVPEVPRHMLTEKDRPIYEAWARRVA